MSFPRALAVFLLVASATAVAAPNDSLQFDPKISANRQLFETMEAQSGVCMERSIHGLLMQGMRSRNQLMAFAESTCGQGWRKWMATVGVPPKAADAYIHKTAQDILEIELANGR